MLEILKETVPEIASTIGFILIIAVLLFVLEQIVLFILRLIQYLAQ